MIHLYDPSTNNHLANIPNDKSSATAAIQAASCSYPKWSGTPVQVRQRYMMEYTHALHKKEVREEIAHWITLEMGKTEGDAMGDVWRGLEVVEAAGRVGSEMMVSYLIVLCRYYLCCHESWKICMMSYVVNKFNAKSTKTVFLTFSFLLFTKGDSLQNLSNGLDTISYRVPMVRVWNFLHEIQMMYSYSYGEIIIT